MKVILTQYHEKLGDVGNVVEVKDGYANNYLLPQGFALPATRGNINQMELVKKAVQKVEAKNIEEAKKLSESLEGLEIIFTVKTGGEGKLYGSVTNKDIAEKILAEKNIEIDRKKIDLEEHIKELGDYTVDLKLYREVKAQLKVRVEPDEESRELIEAYRKEKESQEADSEEEEVKGTEEETGKEKKKGIEKDVQEGKIKEKAEDKTQDKKADGEASQASENAEEVTEKDRGQEPPQEESNIKQARIQKEAPEGKTPDAESQKGKPRVNEVPEKEASKETISGQELPEQEAPGK